MREKARDFANYEEIEKSLEPVVCSNATSTEAITKELIPIKEQIEQLTKMIKPKAVKICRRRHADGEESEEDEENQSIKKQHIDQQFGPLAQEFLKPRHLLTYYHLDLAILAYHQSSIHSLRF